MRVEEIQREGRAVVPPAGGATAVSISFQTNPFILFFDRKEKYAKETLSCERIDPAMAGGLTVWKLLSGVSLPPVRSFCPL